MIRRLSPLDPELTERPRQHIGGPRDLKAREGLLGPMAELVTAPCKDLRDREAEYDRNGDLGEFEAVQGASPVPMLFGVAHDAPTLYRTHPRRPTR